MNAPIKPANLNMLFQQLIPNFAHLIQVNAQSKSEFLATVKNNYSIDNAKTNLFYQSCERSEFETIKLSNDRNAILFNQ